MQAKGPGVAIVADTGDFESLAATLLTAGFEIQHYAAAADALRTPAFYEARVVIIDLPGREADSALLFERLACMEPMPRIVVGWDLDTVLDPAYLPLVFQVVNKPVAAGRLRHVIESAAAPDAVLELRKETRVPAWLYGRLRMQDEVLNLRTRNISMHGMQAEVLSKDTPDPYEPLQAMECRLFLDRGRTVHKDMVVCPRYVVKTGDMNTPRIIGFEFYDDTLDLDQVLEEISG